MKTDHEIQKDVLDELFWEPSVHAAEIGVEVKNGIVTLNGHVRSLAEKHAAEKTAQHVSGVKALASEIDVFCPTQTSALMRKSPSPPSMPWHGAPTSLRTKSKSWLKTAGLT